MNRQRADLVAGLLVAAAVAVGLLFTWDAYQQQQSVQDMGGMMGDSSSMMGSMMGATPNPLWYLVGTLVVGLVLAGGYLLLRPELLDDAPVGSDWGGTQADGSGAAQAVGTASLQDGGIEDPETGGPGTETLAEERGAVPEADGATPSGSTAHAVDSVLTVLPDDERRVLEPVIEEPGLTQIALRDRADFSKSKISQTVSELEKRGLLYREKQGRTFRVYPADDLES